MKKVSKTINREAEVKRLQSELQKLQAALAAATTTANVEPLLVKVEKNEARFKRVKVEDGPDKASGHYLLQLRITAADKAVYIPLSISSGKKPTGFVYHIEGTAVGSIYAAAVSSRGEEITEITLGTIVYAKIPPHKTATFRIIIEIKGKVGNVYRVIVHRINYKFGPTDARYQALLKEIGSDRLKFS